MIKTLQARRARGFTLIELLVVVLILSILMAVALPLYLASQKNAEKGTCRANMQTIANAVQAQKVNDRAANYATEIGATVGAGVEKDLQSTPVCPNGGTYTVLNGVSADNTTFQVHCSVAAHDVPGDFQPGISSS